MNGYMGRGRVFNRIRAAHGMTAIFLFVALFSEKGWGGSLAIRSDPPGAQVFINGTNLGRATPAAIRIRNLPVGRTVITVEKQGYQSVPPSQEVVVAWSRGNIRFSWWPPVLIKNLAGNRWRGITSPRSRRLETFKLVSDEERARLASRGVALGPQGLNPEVAPEPDMASEQKIAVRNVERPSIRRAPKPVFSITEHVEDDPALGDAILGNGDGRIQKGEAFDLVVVVSNVSTSIVKSVTCTIIMPEDTSVKAYSELQRVVSKLAPAAAMTNRFNMAMPLTASSTAEPVIFIEISEKGAPAVVRTKYSLPVESSFRGNP